MDTINDEFEPRYTQPDRKTISTGSTCYLSDLHEREKQCLQKLLKEIYNYSITTDLWTSRAKHASLQEYEMMSCHKNKRSPMKISPGGSTIPCNNWSPPTKTDPHQIDASTTYIYIYIIYIIKHLDISHVAKPVPRDGFQLVSLDNLSISSDEIELVKAVYRQTGSIQKNVQKIKSEQFDEKPATFRLLMVNFT